MIIFGAGIEYFQGGTKKGPHRELAEKSGQSKEEIRKLLELFQEISRKSEISKEELHELNDKLDSYKQL
jgi:methyl-accepting chemotaxis protein